MDDSNQAVETVRENGYKDIEIQCCDCPNLFVFTAGEQDFFARNNYVSPRRCHKCRAAKKRRMANHTEKRDY